MADRLQVLLITCYTNYTISHTSGPLRIGKGTWLSHLTKTKGVKTILMHKGLLVVHLATKEELVETKQS